MASIRTQIVGNRDLGGRFTRVTRKRLARARAFAGQHATKVADGWRARTRSRRVASAIRVHTRPPASFIVQAASQEVGFDPRLVEHDTRPHVIAPTKPHGLLVFPVGDQTVFVKGSVNHPGTTGDHALRRTMEATRGGYVAGLRKVWGGE